MHVVHRLTLFSRAVGSEQRGRREELANDSGYGRHAKEEAPGDVSSAYRRDAGLPGFQRLDNRHARRHQDVSRGGHLAVSRHEAGVRTVPL